MKSDSNSVIAYNQVLMRMIQDTINIKEITDKNTELHQEIPAATSVGLT